MKDFWVGNHLSPHILTHYPFPMLQRSPLSRTFLASIKLLHVYEGFLPICASMKLLFGKYFVFKTLCVRDPEFWMSLHPCLASKAKLNALRSLNPIPALAFGLHIFSQAIHASFLSLSRCPHQKLQIREFSLLHRESGILKQFILYVEMAWATAFIRISRPADDNDFPFQLAILRPTWSLMQLNAFFFPLPTKGGSLKYSHVRE